MPEKDEVSIFGRQPYFLFTGQRVLAENNVRHSRPQEATWGEKGMKQLTARRETFFCFLFWPCHKA